MFSGEKDKYEEDKGKVEREGWKGVPDKKDDGEKREGR